MVYFKVEDNVENVRGWASGGGCESSSDHRGHSVLKPVDGHASISVEEVNKFSITNVFGKKFEELLCITIADVHKK